MKSKDLSTLDIVPIRAILPSGARVDEAYEKGTTVGEIRRDFGFTEKEVDILINGEVVREQTRICELNLLFCKVRQHIKQDRVYIYFIESKSGRRVERDLFREKA